MFFAIKPSKFLIERKYLFCTYSSDPDNHNSKHQSSSSSIQIYDVYMNFDEIFERENTTTKITIWFRVGNRDQHKKIAILFDWPTCSVNIIPAFKFNKLTYLKITTVKFHFNIFVRLVVTFILFKSLSRIRVYNVIDIVIC